MNENVEPRKCAFIHENGESCGAYALKDSLYCFWHDGRPEIEAKRRMAWSRGGSSAHKNVDLDLIAGLNDALDHIIELEEVLYS
nr:hypothetical protein [Candidatus Sigynarchaeota archaeon]